MSDTKDLIIELKRKTGLGMMACKKALDESNGNVEKAIETLRKKGAVKAAEREGKSTKEGVVVSYIHSNNRMGAIVEVNCETDFVAKNEEFIEFAKSIAMQVCALNPLVVSENDVSQELLDKEREIYTEQLKREGKSGDMLEKIIEGKLNKFKTEQSLLKQDYIKDQSKKVEDVLLEIKTKVAENVNIRRFSRFNLGA